MGPGGYQLGNLPAGFAEWNDRFRDTVRRYWRGDPGTRPDLARRLSGSGDVFGHSSRRPWASVNYVTSHDGMTLEDLVSYAHRHNDANGNDNGGHGEPLSANWGAEGPTHNPAILAQRDRVKRAMLTTLFASLGTPMLLAGDEFGRTQQGNNNAYCQDNEISWIDWALADGARGKALIDFVGRIIRIRSAHPALRSPHFLHGRKDVLPGVPNIDWFDERGRELSLHDWRNGEGRALVMRLAAKDADGRADLVAVMANASGETLPFHPPGDFPWRLLLDSSDPGKQTDVAVAGPYRLAAQAAAILAASVESA